MKILLTTTLYILAAMATAHTSAAQGQEQSAPPLEVPQVVSQSNQDAQWQPVTDQRERVLRDVLTYLGAKDEGRFADAYAHFADSQKTSVPFVRWEADMRAFYSSAGQAQGRTLKKVSWYKNPANKQPGIYAAVDFTSQFSELSVHCGFVVLRQQMDGSFTVVREEENSISRREMSKLSPDALRNIRAQYRC